MTGNENLKILMKENGFEVHDDFFDFANVVIREIVDILRDNDTPVETIHKIKKHFGLTSSPRS